jgi:hypothetical protein
MAVQNPPVKGGFEPPVMSFSAVVIAMNIGVGMRVKLNPSNNPSIPNSTTIV